MAQLSSISRPPSTSFPPSQHWQSATRFSTCKNEVSDIGFVIAQTSSDRVDCLKSRAVDVTPQARFEIAEISRSSPGHGMTEPQGRAEAYAVCVHLKEMNDYDVWCDGKHISSRSISAGTVHVGDLRHSWRADVRSPFHVVNFFVSQCALDEIANEQGVSRVEQLICPIGSAHTDTILHNLTLALLPALMRPEQLNRLFADYGARAVIAHLMKSYGSVQLQRQVGGGSLAPWQERRVKELLMSDLSADLTLADLADVCGLSTGHFSHAFRQTVGCPPHQWLIAQRVDRAKQLILNTRQPLSEIALATGFTDQSHFTRVFTQRVKTSPAAWRRAQDR
jgi:AraC family transcriptional regulator